MLWDLISRWRGTAAVFRLAGFHHTLRGRRKGSVL